MSCSKCAQPGTRFCSKCKTTCYCSRTCERSDSKPHSKVCGKPQPAASSSNRPSSSSSSSSTPSGPPPIPDQSDDPVVPPGWIQCRHLLLLCSMTPVRSTAKSVCLLFASKRSS
ncbi:hypothetical protein BDY24DRAFT_244886 [Mrakia frigida]|uniref:uncharacterized protein n=1 Tax=Mrakia frigida TaxID=29902 RepID=UPI003FCC01B3